MTNASGPFRVASFIAFVACVVAFSGCMMQPIQGSSTGASRSFTFSGYTIEPSVAVWIEGYFDSPVFRGFFPMDTTVSNATPFLQPGLPMSRPLYAWSKTVVIPPAYWNGDRARVRSRVRFAGQMVEMWSYDSVGRACVWQRALDHMNSEDPGEGNFDVDAAGMECSRISNGGQDRYEITVRYQ